MRIILRLYPIDNFNLFGRARIQFQNKAISQHITKRKMKSSHSTILFPIMKINKHLNENNFRPNNLIIKI